MLHLASSLETYTNITTHAYTNVIFGCLYSCHVFVCSYSCVYTIVMCLCACAHVYKPSSRSKAEVDEEVDEFDEEEVDEFDEEDQV